MATRRVGILLLAALASLPLAGADKPRTGPETEKRFPPLKVPAGFKATLFACDPLIEYPSAIALGPRPRSLFVAVDYMTGLGTAIVRRDEIRLVEDADGDGYADKAPVYAAGFNSIQGLTFDQGVVYVMHAPFLTALRDRNGDGVAEERHDLLAGLGLTPEENPVRLHCANGLVMGHDGWLYLALGDHGCDVKRPEGDRLVLEGGGILRCRPDGRDLHIFATGLRNIYDVALDDQLNVFVRDNENDGGKYKIRVCHSFCGADHGYPYLYYEHPEEALKPLADLGLGSSAGGLGYLEAQFPAEYRSNLFFCEWGRSVVRCRLQQAGSAFAPVKEIEFAAGADNDPYGFKPTDLVVERDGSLLVADWADGQRPLRGRGRIYRIAYSGKDASQPADDPPREPGIDQWLTRLDSVSYYQRTQAQAALSRQGGAGLATVRKALTAGKLGERGRLHALWLLARAGGPEALDDLFALAQKDPSPQVQAQALRALADMVDPVLTRHRLDAGPGDDKVAARLAALAAGKDQQFLRETVIALGRLRWREAPAWLQQTLTEADPALAHAARQTLRASQNWPAVLKLLDEPSQALIRPLALRACAGLFVPEIVDGLIERLARETVPARRREYADLLSRAYKKPGPWVYWGYTPPPRPAGSVAWERTDAVAQALDRALADPDHSIRLALLRRMHREKVPTRVPNLIRWLQEDQVPEHVAAVLESLRDKAGKDVRAPLAALVADKRHAPANRVAALGILVASLDDASQEQLLDLAEKSEDGPVLAELLRQLGKRPKLAASPVLARKLTAPAAEVRVAALEALAEARAPASASAAEKLLADADPRVRQAAARVAGKLAVRAAADALARLARDLDPGVRRASLDALRLLHDPRAVPLAVAALADPQMERQALDCIGELGGPDQAAVVTDLARRHPAAEVLVPVTKMLTAWASRADVPATRRRELERAVADIQGHCGILLHWHVAGPIPSQESSAIVERLASPASSDTSSPPAGWRIMTASGTEAPLNLGPAQNANEKSWFGYTDVVMAEETPVQFLAASSGRLRIWLNGRLLHRRDQAQAFQLDSDRFDATLARGANRLLVEVSAPKGAAEFHLRWRRKSALAEHERLMQTALVRRGDPDRGRKLFLDAEKSLCVKCHRLAGQGEQIGPELTGVGSRFPRIHIIESILEPSRTIASSFQTLLVTLKDGRTLAGIKIAETDQAITLANNQGQKHVLPKSNIEEQRPQPLSTMPDGLEKRLTQDEFIDLIAFLVSQKETRSPP